ncbi:ABC transporter ATP-binding protein [Macrococcoides canis]|uniref:ABC transporter ATP-binding protein n=1 Tax=Macrococcoides canis TaxID=1855823 RepID=UPI00105CAF24|nr:ABC transporter ATP-binding protein [Macrococcus canis]TDM32435.1 ABC transporter ATP-binding protein [Macrococcus canis]
MAKVEVNNVSKVYDVNFTKKNKFFSFFNLSPKKKTYYYALRDISFEVEAGQSVGIIGLNGSGKSTLSNLLAEVTQPTKGSIKIDGRSSLIAISAGLNNEFTGEENIRMKCLMHGMTEKEINEKYEDIVAFSELGGFIYQPIKSYSSGMRSRLGFAIAIHTDPDVLIVDEALSVGDDTFSNKCIDKMKEFQKRGKTIFFVSHTASQIRQMCDKAIWLHYGEMKAYGNCESVVYKYIHNINQYKKLTKEEQLEYKALHIQKQTEEKDEVDRNDLKKIEEKIFDLPLIIQVFILTVLMLISVYYQLN